MTKTQNTSRRKFLIRTAALGCSAAASPFITPITLAAAPWDQRLVVIILRGAMDGLDVVRPLGDTNYAAYRPTLARDAEGGTDLDGYFSLSPHLSSLAPLWQQGQLAFAHAVSTPYRDKRSHFEGQDLLEAGTGMDVPFGAIKGGWLNRMLGQVPGVSVRTAFSVGRGDMMVLSGDVPVSSWSPDARMDLSPSGKRLLQEIYHGDPLFQEAGNIAVELTSPLAGRGQVLSAGLERSAGQMMKSMLGAAKSSRAGALAKFAGEQLNQETRIAAFSIGGWDTHRGQSRALKSALTELGYAVLTLRETLGSNWQNTAVLAMTEFGRTARENGSGGTDHGTGGLMLMAGGAIRGGKIYGDWPGLGDADLYQTRDLFPTTDVRDFAAQAMRGMFGLNRDMLEGVVFPGLDMGLDRRILL